MAVFSPPFKAFKVFLNLVLKASNNYLISLIEASETVPSPLA